MSSFIQKNKMHFLFLLLVTGLLALAFPSTPSLADGIQIGQPTYGGTGCPAGTASVTLSPDQSELITIFENFVVEAGKTTGRHIDRKSCNLAIPIKVPKGYTVSLQNIRMKGFHQLPKNSKSRIHLEIFYAGSRGPILSREYAGPRTGEFELAPALQEAHWSPCGQSVNLRLNLSVMVSSNEKEESTIATMDSLPPLKVIWRKCQ